MAPSSALDPKLEQWLAHFRGPLIGLLASWGSDWQSAEELAMDTFAEAWLGRERMRADVDDLDAVGAWLRGIAQNLWRSHQRKRSRVTSLEERHEHVVAAESGDEPDEQQEALRRAFPELHLEHQEVLRMHYLEQTTAREVAALLGETQKAVEMRLYQARRALRYFADKQLRTEGAER